MSPRVGVRGLASSACMMETNTTIILSLHQDEQSNASGSPGPDRAASNEQTQTLQLKQHQLRSILSIMVTK